MFSLVITSILGSASILAPLSEPTALIALGLILIGSGRALRRIRRDIGTGHRQGAGSARAQPEFKA